MVKAVGGRAEEHQPAHDRLMAHRDVELGFSLQGRPEIRNLLHRDDGCVDSVQGFGGTHQATLQQLGVKLGDANAQAVSLHG